MAEATDWEGTEENSLVWVGGCQGIKVVKFHKVQQYAYISLYVNYTSKKKVKEERMIDKSLY